MYHLRANIYSVAAVRSMDRIAIENHDVPGYTLMERAGEAAADEICDRFPDAEHWLIVCGVGNNAGDGYVVARLADEYGIGVTVVSLADPAVLKGDAATAYADFVADGGEVERWAGDLDVDADLVVDAIFGSGLSRDLDGDYAKAVECINWYPAPVVALDIPSGLDGDTGEVRGAAVTANLTTTFVGLKTGLFLAAGAERCGEVTLSTLDIPPEWVADVRPVYRGLDDVSLLLALPERRRAAHKGQFGHVLVVGGGPGMPGASLICGAAALRAGAGRVTVATHPSHAAVIAATRPELMTHAIVDGDDLAEPLDRADVVAFGPGLGRSAWAESVYEMVAASDKPSVWDADALNWLAERPGSKPGRVVTPHPGEAARLLDRSIDAVQQDRDGAVAELVDRYGGVAVLKGRGTLVSDGNDVPYFCTNGNPGMASPGIGDALTGIIAALLAQGIPAPDAAATGVEVHARAGDIAAGPGERGLLASDLVDALRMVVNP